MKNRSLISTRLLNLSFYRIVFFIVIGQLIIPLHTFCQPNTMLWQLGVVDSSYHEFGQNTFSQTDAKNNHYVIDKDAPDKWNAFLPSVNDKEPEPAQEIEFSIYNFKPHQIATVRLFFEYK